MVSRIELAFRVATALFVILAPTVLFLALWRALELLRDDEIIARARENGNVGTSLAGDTDEDGTGMIDQLTAGAGARAGAGAGSTVTCDACGAPNVADATYCRQCLGRLPAE